MPFSIETHADSDGHPYWILRAPAGAPLATVYSRELADRLLTLNNCESESVADGIVREIGDAMRWRIMRAWRDERDGC